MQPWFDASLSFPFALGGFAAPVEETSSGLALKPPATTVTGPDLWNELHSYRYTTKEAAIAFYADWQARLKLLGLCDCVSHWQALCTQYPPNFESEEEFFVWGFDQHNRVNARLDTIEKPHPQFSLQNARRRFSRIKTLWAKRSTVKEFAAVTSLSPQRIERQRESLESWRQMGLTIYAMQLEDEVDASNEQFGDLVDRWHIQKHPR